MTEAKHTEGPWEYADGAIYGVSPWNVRVKIARVEVVSTLNGIDATANGRLIAKAPEMFEHLLAIASYADAPHVQPEQALKYIRETARAAIAAATGSDQ